MSITLNGNLGLFIPLTRQGREPNRFSWILAPLSEFFNHFAQDFIGKILRIGLLVLFISATLSLAATSDPNNISAEKKSNATENDLLGITYRDLRNGFSLRRPAGSELIQSGDQCSLWPGLDNWEILQIPASKKLICFIPSHHCPATYLIVYLLATKEKMNIKQILEARQNYWQKSAGKVEIKEKKNLGSGNRPEAVLTVHWQPDKKKKQVWIIREALIENEPDRFFLLTAGRKTLSDPPSAVSPPKPDLETILKHFVTLNKAEENRNWRQARKNGQILLEQLKLENIKKKLVEERWFLIFLDKRPVGFHYVSERVTGSSAKQNLEISFHSFLANEKTAYSFISMQGWPSDFCKADLKNSRRPRPVRLNGKFKLNNALNSEEITYRIIGPNEIYLEQALWKKNNLTITRGNKGHARPKTEKMEVNVKLYLPWAKAELLGRLLTPPLNRDFVFVRYFNHSLSYYTLLCNDKVQMPPPPPELNTTYLIGQFNDQGPIVETWLDKQGQIIKSQYNGMIMRCTTKKTIKQLWPLQMEKTLTYSNRD